MKTLTRNKLIEHGWNKLSVINADMIEKYGYTQIGEYAFYNCHNLTSITIPNSVTSIGDWAFAHCCNLTSITIPNSVSSIGDYAFYGCSFTTIIIPNSVTSIGDWAFAHCCNLTSITIPNSVTSIGEGAFEFCGINPPKHYDNQGRLIAYKGFNRNMQCRGFQYTEGQTYETDKAVLCKCGFHACTNPLDVFAYYFGEINKDMFIHEVYLEDVNDEENNDSKVVAKKITIGKRLNVEDINKIIQEK
jgi:hypothetical protein